MPLDAPVGVGAGGGSGVSDDDDDDGDSGIRGSALDALIGGNGAGPEVPPMGESGVTGSRVGVELVALTGVTGGGGMRSLSPSVDPFRETGVSPER